MLLHEQQAHFKQSMVRTVLSERRSVYPGTLLLCSRHDTRVLAIPGGSVCRGSCLASVAGPKHTRVLAIPGGSVCLCRRPKRDK